MKNLIAIFLGLSCLSSCSFSKEGEALTDNTTTKVTRLNNLNNKEVPGEFLSLYEQEEMETVTSDIGGNLYGKFFNERAEFFIIENPTNKLHDTEVNSITLYYLDGQLGKTKYLLQHNVANKLIECYGNFKISAHDDKNRDILKSGKVLIKTGEDISLNQQLDNYQLSWTSGNNMIVYKVNINDKQETYKYVEKRSTYEQNFKEIEKSWVVN